eukprot:m.1382265 g.1382265  ORF g.1382265 m.1382265 type:complete len:501 (-) comp24972_c1_seq12:3290-4792(-)
MSAPKSQRYPKLHNFFVYNPTFDRSEATEHEKLLFFYPPEVSHDQKMKSIGLAEALIKYSSTFSKEKPCEVVHTLKVRQVFYNPEPDFWLSLSVTIPFSPGSKKDGTPTYHEESVQNVVLEAFLKQIYNMYKLFNGTLTNTLADFNREALVHKLDMFFPQYIRTLDYEHGDVVDAFNGIQFLPLDKNTYLRIQCFVNLTESEFDAIKYSVFIYNDHLVWSGLEQDDMRVLYRYLTQGPGRKGRPRGAGSGVSTPSSPAVSSVIVGGSDPANMFPGSPSRNLNIGFVTGPEDLQDPQTAINAPRLFVGSIATTGGQSESTDGSGAEESAEELYLVIYQCNEIKLCLVVSGDAVMDFQFYMKLHAFVARPLQDLGRLIYEQQAKRNTAQTEVQYKYLYFNHMNLAQKSSFMVLPKKAGGPLISSVAPEYIQYLTDMHTDFSSSHEESEIILKTNGDCWVVGRQSDQRQFFVILNQKNANMIEINEEIRRLSQTHFGNIFFVD